MPDATQRQGMVWTSHVPVGLDGAQEELGAVGVGASVGHREDAGALVLELAANEQRHVHMSAALPPSPHPLCIGFRPYQWHGHLLQTRGPMEYY